MKEDFKNIGILSILLLTVSVFVNPIGEFCLYDDWSFAYSMKIFFETGKVNFSDWTSMPLITQILWGNIFTNLWGYSFTILRISTIVISFFGIWGTYFFFKETTQKSNASLLLSGLFLIQAVFLNFVYSFNTDIPFYSIIIWSAYFFVRYLKYDKLFDYLAALLTLAASILLRDIGIALALGFSVAMLYSKGLKHKSAVIVALPIILGFALMIGWKQYLISIDSLPALYDDGRARMFEIFNIGFFRAIAFLTKNILWFAAYMGVFLSPLFIAKYDVIFKSLKNNKTIASISIMLPLLLIFAGILSDSIAAKFPEILFHHIFGMTLWGSVHEIIGGTMVYQSRVYNLLGLFLGAWGIFNTLSLFSILFDKLKSKQRIDKANTSILILSFFSIFVYISPVILAGIYMKYLIFVFPFALLLIYSLIELVSIRRSLKIAAMIASFAIFYFSIATTADILAEERARWEVAEEMRINFNADPAEIDGGICYNGWYLYDYNYKRSSDKNWWWVIDDKYLVADGQIESYSQVAKRVYYRWLPPFHRTEILGLKRIENEK